jgi:polysaccharide chain length determinant protein (PEP-CTERM system associated)
MESQEKENQSPFPPPAVILHILSKRRWFLIIPLIVAICAGIGLAIFLPKKYEAQTIILIEGQSVPTEYVRSLVTDGVDERITTLSQQILSRTNLEKIITDFNLYQSADPEDMFMEDKVNALRNSIVVEVTADARRREANAFAITHRGKDPRKVMLVTNSLAGYFIDQNMKIREAQAVGTSSFLDGELISMRKRLEEKEQAVKSFRTQNMGTLPEQLETNLRILDRLQEELTERQEALREARARLSTLQNQPPVLDPSAVANGTIPQDIDQLKAQLVQLQMRYTEKHPDIIKLKQRIRQMEENPPDSIQSSYENPLVTGVRIEIGNLQADIANIQGQIRQYQRRVESTPGREQEFLSLQRDYENLKESYGSLLNRKLEAEIAVNLERKQKGEQFRIIDKARIPERPVEPNMKRLLIFTIFGGLGIGGGIIFLLENTNKSFRTVQDLQKATELPTLAIVPMLESGRQKLFNKLNRAMTFITLAITLVMLVFFIAITMKGLEPILELIRQV